MKQAMPRANAGFNNMIKILPLYQQYLDQYKRCGWLVGFDENGVWVTEQFFFSHFPMGANEQGIKLGSERFYYQARLDGIRVYCVSHYPTFTDYYNSEWKDG